MNASEADQQIKQVVKDLLSRDPVQFNSTINAHFASGCTYQGRGLKITGASQLKHSAYLLNALDFGSAAKITDQDIHWDAAGTTAVVKATRHLRPIFFPLFQFAVTTKVILAFNAEETAKDSLFCTQWRDEWPLEQVIQKLPVVRYLYNFLLVPALTMVFLWASDLAFWLHSKVETVEHRYARDVADVYRQKVEPRLPPSLAKGFDAGVHAAEHVGQHSVHVISRVSHGPLRAVEELARTATVILNLALPHQLQIPYPSVFAERAQAAPVKVSTPEVAEQNTTKKDDDKNGSVSPKSQPQPKSTNGVKAEGSQSPKKKVSGSLVDRAEQKSADETTTDQPVADDAEAAAHKRKAETSPADEPRHAKVVVGPSENGSQAQAKEIDVVTQQVTEKATAGESSQQSLYDVLKKDGQLPSTGGSGGADGRKGEGKKKGKDARK
ncbi:uncharacterized protein UHOD_02471 [Ustilago sp. UG-2017b]|nr:uncharacterized protein UHOD_02471 [Ustilago sp. UG-2017b]